MHFEPSQVVGFSLLIYSGALATFLLVQIVQMARRVK